MEASLNNSPIIVNVLRVDLKAKHKLTEAELFLPQVHILIESIDNNFIATCPEYLLSTHSDTIKDAVGELISILFKYFFEMIKKHRIESIYKALSETNAESVWAKIRVFKAKKHEAFLEFIEDSFDPSIDLSVKAKALPKLNPSEEFNKRNSELKLEINALKKELAEMKKQRDEARANLNLQSYGLEGSQEYEEEIVDISLASV